MTMNRGDGEGILQSGNGTDQGRMMIVAVKEMGATSGKIDNRSGRILEGKRDPARLLLRPGGEVTPRNARDDLMATGTVIGTATPTAAAGITGETADLSQMMEVLPMPPPTRLKTKKSRSALASSLPCRRQLQTWTRTGNAGLRPLRRQTRPSEKPTTGSGSAIRSTEAMPGLPATYTAGQPT